MIKSMLLDEFGFKINETKMSKRIGFKNS